MDFTPQQLALIEKYRYINTDHFDNEYHQEYHTEYLKQMMGFTVDKLYWSVSYSQGDGACFIGHDSDMTQLLMWSLLPDYRVWWKALSDSGPAVEHPLKHNYVREAINHFTETMGFQGEIICQQFDYYYNQLLDKLGDNVSHFLDVGVDLEEVRLWVTHNSSHYYHSNTVDFSWDIPEPMSYVGSKYDKDDIRRVILEGRAEDFHTDLECVTEEVEDYLRSVMDDIYDEIRSDIEYQESDEAVWDTIVANGLDELEEDVA